jgi:hypothetical protein
MALSRTLTLYLAVAAAAALPAASAFCAAPLLLRAGSRTPAARSMTMGPVPIVIPTASSGAKIPRVLHAESPGFAASAHAPTPCADAAYRRQGHELERVSRRRGRFGYRVGMETSQVCGGAQGGCVRCRTASGTRSGLAGLHGSLVGLHGSLVGLLSINRTRLPLFALLPPLRPTNTC